MTETTETLIYTGRRIMRTLKVGYSYLLQDGSDDSGLFFSSPLTTGTKVGALLQVTVADEGDGNRSVYSKGEKRPRVVDHLPSTDPRLLEWAALDHAAAAEHRLNVESTRITKAGEDPLIRQLAPVRDLLAGMSEVRRTAAIGWILTYLMTGRR